ncbi:MAG TPA: hypothetical protein VNA69_00575, partial [Thermoanaerobaculia bacterium]|nr:hypothetical protein [Thermoanaerobaculia bacterium]
PGPSLTLPRNSIFSNPQTTRDQYFANFYESCTLKKFLPLRRGAARRPPLGMTWLATQAFKVEGSTSTHFADAGFI